MNLFSKSFDDVILWHDPSHICDDLLKCFDFALLDIYFSFSLLKHPLELWDCVLTINLWLILYVPSSCTKP